LATNEEIQQLTGRLMLDPAFRAEFTKDPVAAAKSANIDLTPDQAESFKQNLDRVIDAAAEIEKAEVSAHGHAVAVFANNPEK